MNWKEMKKKIESKATFKILRRKFGKKTTNKNEKKIV
jgi:hypothetical protein